MAEKSCGRSQAALARKRSGFKGRCPSSPRGSVTCGVSLTDTTRPQAVQIFHRFEAANGKILTANGSFDPISGAAPQRSSLCRIQEA